MVLSADTIVQSAYDRSAAAEAYAKSQAGKISSIATLEENLTPLIKNIALGAVALIVAIAIIKSKRGRK